MGTTLIFSNEEIDDIMKIVKSPEESGILIKGVSETIENEAKERNEGFLVMILGTLAPDLLESVLIGKAVIGTDKGAISRSWEQDRIRADQDF